MHINSGIPNRALYLAAVSIGGHAWDAPGHIWHEALALAAVEFADLIRILLMGMEIVDVCPVHIPHRVAREQPTL
ncbi:M4 family metallopeptidase [Dactylosporangium sp. AC04546]|uniref:M4 family metallopeptidase n=1 Tax=Dactylosporangium sp. AC04546 TaxID=2862460 RepID=UPI001EE138EF|nr:M4 family metallopeptidase [Dactylosporangium sp. AC04546]WVK86885.1 M4 family metallopeptidase [Dactylosporangium sp. AC04546]